MRFYICNCNRTVLFLLLATSLSIKAQQPLKLNSINPHYFEYGGKPVLLITSAEHYGAVINPDFNYVAYLNALHEQGMNNTRVFSGSMVERPVDIRWMKNHQNTLAPRPGRLIAPWARSRQTGYAGGGNKFDLDEWDDNYFKRLKDFITEAGKRGIFVELTLFGNQYQDSLWMNSPLYPANNIQGEGPSGEKSFLLFQTLKDPKLVARQEALVTKIVQELNDLDNLYYEICNEPYNNVTDTAAVDEWHNHMIGFVKKAEESLPKKHLIASNESAVDNSGVAVANYHYVHVLNMPPFDWLYGLNKVLSMDETEGSLIHSKTDDVRIEAWDFIFKGGGAYNNLSWEYTPSNPSGTDSARMIRVQLQHLQQFMAGLDYIKCSCDTTVVARKPSGAFVRCLSDKGRQYMIYLHHSKQKGNDFIAGYKAIQQHFRDTLTLNIPAGKYTAQFFNPATGKMIRKAKASSGSVMILHTPGFLTDISIVVSKQ